MAEIVLNLDNIRDAQAFENSNEILQRNGMVEFFRYVAESLLQAKVYRQSLLRETKAISRIRRHNTISISGSRGSGKTTFLLNMLNLIQKGEVKETFGNKLLDKGVDFQKIEVLEILDPTLIEAKEHVFVNIISRIKDRVDDLYRDGLCSRHNGNKEYAYRKWHNHLKSLASGLPALDGIGGNRMNVESWMDPVHVMEKGLTDVRSATNLEVNFHKFVDVSLDLLNKEAFVLALDDIDTNFASGWQVLEILRKYLTTPQIITVLSGDLELYSKLVRKHQWESFGDTLLEQENERKADYSKIVDQLENQYLLKILKPERRIILRTIGELIKERNDDHQIMVRIGSDDPVSFQDYFKLLCENGLLVVAASSQIRRLYENALLNEPIRFLAQLLHASRVFVKIKVDGHDPFPSFQERLLDLMEQSLSKLGFKNHELRTIQPQSILNFMVFNLAKRGLLVSGSDFLPNYDDTAKNQVMIALSTVLTRHLNKNHHLFFEYFVKVGLSCEIANQFKYNSEGEQASVENYFQHIKLDSSPGAMSIAHASTGYFRTKGIKGTSNATTSDSALQKQHQFGSVAAITSLDTIGISTNYVKKRIISIYGFSGLMALKGAAILENTKDINDSKAWDNVIQKVYNKHNKKSLTYPIYDYWKSYNDNSQYLTPALKDKGGKSFPKKHVPYFNLISGLTNDISSWHANYVRQLFSTTKSASGGRCFLISIHSLLALIGELYSVYSVTDNFKRDALRILMETDHECPVPSRIGYSLLESINDKENDDEFEIGNAGNVSINGSNRAIDDLQESVFEELLKKWSLPSSGTLQITPQLMNRISNRFHQALGQIDTDIADSNKYLGVFIHRYIVAFLNAVMIEEAILSNIKLVPKNAVTSDDVFLSNYNKLPHDALPIFRWAFKCPVWGLYLQPKEIASSEKTKIMDIYEKHLYPEHVSAEKDHFRPDPTQYRRDYEEMIKISFLKVEKVFDNLFAPLNSVLLQGHVR